MQAVQHKSYAIAFRKKKKKNTWLVYVSWSQFFNTKSAMVESWLTNAAHDCMQGQLYFGIRNGYLCKQRCQKNAPALA